MDMNYDYLSAEEFDLMTEEEFLDYLDKKAAYLREKYEIKKLPPYHQKLGAMITKMAQGDKIEINHNKIKQNGRNKSNG